MKYVIRKILVFVLLITFLIPSYTSAKTKKVFSLNESIINLVVGDTFQFEAINTNTKTTYTINKSKAIKVSKSGKITAIKAGKAIVTGKSNNEKASCIVIVRNKPDIGPGQENFGSGVIELSYTKNLTLFNAIKETPIIVEKNKKTPSIYLRIGTRNFDKHKEFFYIDGYKISPYFFGTYYWDSDDTACYVFEINDFLTEGTHEVEIIQYIDDDPTKEMITYISRTFDVEYK